MMESYLCFSGSEIERKYSEIMKQTGVLTIDGQVCSAMSSSISQSHISVNSYSCNIYTLSSTKLIFHNICQPVKY